MVCLIPICFRTEELVQLADIVTKTFVPDYDVMESPARISGDKNIRSLAKGVNWNFEKIAGSISNLNNAVRVLEKRVSDNELNDLEEAPQLFDGGVGADLNINDYVFQDDTFPLKDTEIAGGIPDGGIGVVDPSNYTLLNGQIGDGGLGLVNPWNPSVILYKR